MDTPALGLRSPGASDRERIEEAHHELCTALTSVRSNVALARIQLQGVLAAPERAVQIKAHLHEVETAVERLERLAKELRVWHARSRGR